MISFSVPFLRLVDSLFAANTRESYRQKSQLTHSGNHFELSKPGKNKTLKFVNLLGSFNDCYSYNTSPL